ncbi:hypothetical protein ACIRPX_20775 [Streptomyces sp. NPDC101225]|uniref:hypothetical protein n=1 Tax=Streptomyces sp. NPDC101225 TaxID=3366135 RepID=UPI0037F11380
MMSEADGAVAGAALVRIVPAEIGEGVAGVLAGAVADVLVWSTVDDLRLSGTAGRVQVIGFVALTLLWAINLLVYRPRQLRAFGSAVAVEEPLLPERRQEQIRHLRRGRVRVAAFVLSATLGSAYLIRMPLVGVAFQLVLVLGLLHTWRTAVWWERRHGLRLWKPALSAVGREAYRRAPYYVTPAEGGPAVSEGGSSGPEGR